MADKPITEPLVADLPEDWTFGKIVPPNGSDLSLEERYGYNYLMHKVNESLNSVNTLNEASGELREDVDQIKEQGVSVADTLPIGAQVMWDDKNPLPDNWQYVDDDVSDNRQLLINNDFQINQRGKSSYTLNSSVELNYTLDMWAIYVEDDESSITVTVEKDGVLIETTGTGKKQFFQTLTDKIQEYISNFTGVASFYVESVSGNVAFEKWSYDDSTFEKIKEVTQGVNVGYIKNKNIGRIQFTFDGVCSLKLKYCDLFEGDVAYQHQREHYATVLDRCYDYIQSLSNGELRVLMVASTQDGVAAGFGFYKKMISKPIVVALEVKNSKGERLSKAVALCDEYGVMRISANGSPEWTSNTYMYLEDLIVSCEPL